MLIVIENSKFLAKIAGKAFIIFAAFLVLSQTVLSQPDMRNMEELIKKYEPLKMFAGKWRQNFVFSQPNREPIYGNGLYENQMMWAEVLLEMTVNTEYPTGTTVGKIILGYDRFKDIYFFLNYDAYGSLPLVAKGSYDAKKKEFNFKGTEEVVTPKGIKSTPFKAVFRFERDTKYIYELYKGEDNKKILETICTRTAG